ncbi:four helix bundle protein [Flavobacterium sp. WC2509]|uniref:four helix bundle protein n=1 Tax=Flavobacterium sp. WC2509 TaxID=3461406 RepID=UPI004044FA2E
MHRFKDLEIWKQSRKFCSEIYLVTTNFPESEKFGLTNQLRRASVSVPSNIAEGCSRSSNKDFSRFLEIAIGSIYEIETQLLIALDLGYINQIKLDELSMTIDRITKMTSKFRSTLK